MKQSHPVTFTLGVILAFPAALFLLYAVYSIAQVAGGVVIQGPNLVVPGNVGIGTPSPGAKLEVAQNNAIKVGQAYLSSGGDYAHLANNEWYNGSAWQSTAPGALIQLSGQRIDFGNMT